MRASTRLGAAAIAAAAVFAGIGSSSALAVGTSHAVFVQNDNVAGNQIVAYDRADDGTLTQAGTYNTGGLGGVLEGSASDHLAAQGSLVFDREENLLYAVNAGSNTISVFGVIGDRLALHQVIASGGSFPVSITARRGVVYVLNALEGGSVQGYRVASGHLTPIAGSVRALGLNPTETPQFTHTPGQVAFTPGGSQLLVTTKGNGSDIDVFAVKANGTLSKSPVVNSLPGAVPFAVSFDKQEDLVVAEAAGALASFKLLENGTVSQLDSVPTGKVATCWVTRSGAYFYASSTGSASLESFNSSAGGALLTLLGNAETDPGTVDASVTRNGDFIYVQAGITGTVDEFAIGAQGALNKVGVVTLPGGIGGEGIVAG
jgi:6-phosphogluconolactonase (cycloisomerase 2 family)